MAKIYILTARPPAAGKAKGLCGTAGKMTAETQQANKPYEAKNVLITGGAGFIASHVAILFAKKYPQYKVRPRAPWKRAAPARVRAREAARAPAKARQAFAKKALSHRRACKPGFSK